MTVYKKVEVVGTSGTSVSDAIRGAVNRAAMTLEDLQWFEVKEIRGRIAEGEVAEYQVALEIAFTLHAPREETGEVGSAREEKHVGAQTRGTRSLQAQAVARKGGKGQSGISRSFEKQPGSRKR